MEEPARKIGPYDLVSKIGQGTFGVVWLAERRASLSTTQVALKLPRSEDIDLETFEREAAIWVQASGHNNVLRLIEAEVYDGQVVIVSAYASDGSLEAWRTRHGGRAPSVETACEMMEGVLSGLAHLHRRRIIHRDLKPDNILLQEGTPLLADFGISRMLRSSSHFTKNVTGTFAYMAPEAFDGKRDEQTDLWAAGVIFYELLAGRLPFDQQDTASLVGTIVRHDPPELPAGLVPEVLRRVVAKALRRDPAERYRSAEEMLRDLREAGHQLWLERHRQSPPPNPSRGDEAPPTRLAGESPRRRSWSAGTIAVALLAAVAIVGLTIAVVSGIRQNGRDSSAVLNSNYLLGTPTASPLNVAATPVDLVKMLNGRWVFAEWANFKDAVLDLKDGHGTFSSDTPFNVLQDVSWELGECPEGQGFGYILRGSNPRMSGSNFKPPKFSPDELCVNVTTYGFKVWTRDQAHNKEWSEVEIRTQPPLVPTDEAAVLDGDWQFIYPGKTQVSLRMEGRRGTLTNRTMYPATREVDVADSTESYVILRVSSPVLAADKNTQSEEYPPGEFKFVRLSDRTFIVYWRTGDDSTPFRQVKVKSSPNNN
ncbi:MAG: serine/threonine protein kinase [Pyrinomonadaceae bacterium]